MQATDRCSTAGPCNQQGCRLMQVVLYNGCKMTLAVAVVPVVVVVAAVAVVQHNNKLQVN